MPNYDVIQSHFAAADQTSFNNQMNTLEALFQPKCKNLSPEENDHYGTINETNKLLVEKVRDYRNTQPALSSPDVNWPEFNSDAFDRLFLETSAARLMALAKTMLETKRVHDYDNFQNALLDYRYTRYKSSTSPGTGYDSKAEDLKQFFPATGSGESGDSGNNAPA